ncbi:MFS transporter [Actinoplanes sp. NPDC023936]|uniref:MFS transporter n=1 Tax=Actinoplanes sp. NPDC023936 TaxID=3154910 RepID=UPI0033C5D0D5
MLWLVPGNLPVFLTFGIAGSVLMPVQVSALDPDNKVASLALVTAVAGFFSMVTQPLVGMLSDRTRTRFGARAPWIVAGALMSGLSLIGMAMTNGITQILIAWSCVGIAQSVIAAPVNAILPDRVPAAARGRFAAVVGLTSVFGAIGGQAAGSALAADVGRGYLLLAGIVIVFAVLFVVFNPDHSNATEPRPPLRLGTVLRSFWVNPRRYPDFAWAFAGRLCFFTGYGAVLGFNLFLLQDYIGLGDRAVGYVAVLGSAMLLGLLPATAVAGPLSDRIGRRKPFIFVASLLVAAGFAIPWTFPTLAGMITAQVIIGIGVGAWHSVDQALVTEVLPSQATYGSDLGIINIATALPGTIAPALGGAIVTLAGYAGLFPFAIGTVLLSSVAIFFIKSVR